MGKIEQKHLFCFLSVFVFLVISIYKITNHIPWYDEINAYNIAQNLSLSEIFSLTKYEGHLSLWYLFLIPFAKSNIGFPYPMLILNLVFAVISIGLLWKYSPFNNLEKTFITISSPMIFYSTVARCYSLSIMFLFGLAALYPKRIQHPYWYSVLLILTANTSVMALFGAFILGLLFLHDMFIGYKNKLLSKKNIIIMFLIFIFGGISILLQLVNPNPQSPDWLSRFDFAAYFWNNLLFNDNIYEAISRYLFLAIIIFIPLFFKKNYKPMLFIYGVCGLLIYLFTHIFPGSVWHTYFFYIYICIGFWLYKYNKPEKYTIIQKIILTLFGLYLAINVFQLEWDMNGTHVRVIDYVNNNRTKYENKNLFYWPADSYIAEVFPHFYKSNIIFKDCSGNPPTEFNHYKNQSYKPDNIDKNIVFNNKKDTYIWVDEKDNSDFLKELRKNKISLKSIKCVEHIAYTYIYKIQK